MWGLIVPLQVCILGMHSTKRGFTAKSILFVAGTTLIRRARPNNDPAMMLVHKPKGERRHGWPKETDNALASGRAHHHAFGMFVITEADAAAIRAIFDQEGELSAAIELRRRFPGITDNAKARTCAQSIAGWTPLPTHPRPVTRLRPRKDS
jgi:hypothetical protein